MEMNAGLNRIVFMDRDGVINRDSPDYIKGWSEFEFLPGSLEAMAHLTRNGFRIIIVTNQSIINRGMVRPAILDDMFRRMTQAVREAGGDILDIFFCPHRPEEDCDCRKPRTGMLQKARRIHGLDLSRTYMVGDNAKDIECARNAGCGSAILVLTGSGLEAVGILERKGIRPDHVAADLLAAARWITGGGMEGETRS
ncbi:MAG: D-glycero-beta-D-manno-heptose 1,7-bisphosphate 7-phosphatase [Thermodesulfobacteriota bacterium]